MSAHILVVEDDAVTRQRLVYRLEYAGYRVTQAADGRAALDLLETKVFDVVVTDIVLGTVDGIEVLHAARRMYYRPAVILLTGYGSLSTCIDALRLGAYDYLLKPCSPSALLQSIKGAIDRHNAEYQLQEAIRILASPNGPLPEKGRGGKEQGEQAKMPSFPINVGELTIGPTRHHVFFRGKHVRLTPIEYVLLLYLAERAGKVCQCSDIVEYTHGMKTDDADAQSLLRTHLHNIRKKIDPSYFVNDRGCGYMLVVPQEGVAGDADKQGRL